MKMLMVICPESRQADIRALIGQHDVRAYSEVAQVVGEGITGKRLGTQVWPGRSILLFTVIPDDKREALLAALRECRDSLYPGEGMKAFVLPVEEAL